MDSLDINDTMDAPSVPVLSSFVDFCKAPKYKRKNITNTTNSSNTNNAINAPSISVLSRFVNFCQLLLYKRNNNANMMNDPSVSVVSSFPKFPLFPKEIQLKIWFQALPEGQIVYANRYGFFPPPAPHALYDVSLESREVFLKHYKRLYTHTTGCNYAESREILTFYNPLEDTVIFEADMSFTPWLSSSRDKLLCRSLLCCDERKRFFAELRHIAILADRQHYFIDLDIYVVRAIIRALMLTNEDASPYEEFFTTYPMLESFSFVIGSNTVQNTAREFPRMRFVKTDPSREAIVEEYYQEKIEEICNGFEKWKETHPEVNIPQIEIVYAATNVPSSQDNGNTFILRERLVPDVLFGSVY
ncbi:hypothetical protein BCON_0111g00170 [Botryotinia convoluta]|uniref:2EXR domain-containing protein n=1 Tax=Botryotinia convoluta TaxID=54673 RepID=A0A4Z1I023_9HELO|nr:hypothetical protein BCON_0111g00170 [Botryotinia convoluta]